MSTPDQAPDLDTPTTSSEATPGSERSLHSTIHIVRSEEDHDGLVQQPPKLTLKLRTLAEKPAPSPTDVQTDLPDPDNGALIGVRHGDQISQEKLTKHLRWLVATPASSIPAKATGSMKNPIDVDTLKTPSPHKFVNRPVGYFAPIPLQYRPSRPNLASQLTTPNGAAIISGKVGGHESHDIYKAFIARRKVSRLLVQIVLDAAACGCDLGLFCIMRSAVRKSWMNFADFEPSA
ncbi:hypothetical protein CC80DRAFT_495474 [Byssothecium circinans]|uniref:Uncharacterized protein n=1 Tax=Byssothecium circinans TaxID=147558 RepID=A0A6A5TIC3_9PLEO|nr:hypothetical protein CC80DRAFT_495474 [Byssothecium circinans]